MYVHQVGNGADSSAQLDSLESAIVFAFVGEEVIRIPAAPARGLAVQVHELPLVLDQVRGHAGKVRLDLGDLFALRGEVIARVADELRRRIFGVRDSLRLVISAATNRRFRRSLITRKIFFLRRLVNGRKVLAG